MPIRPLRGPGLSGDACMAASPAWGARTGPSHRAADRGVVSGTRAAQPFPAVQLGTGVPAGARFHDLRSHRVFLKSQKNPQVDTVGRPKPTVTELENDGLAKGRAEERWRRRGTMGFRGRDLWWGAGREPRSVRGGRAHAQGRWAAGGSPSIFRKRCSARPPTPGPASASLLQRPPPPPTLGECAPEALGSGTPQPARGKEEAPTGHRRMQGRPPASTEEPPALPRDGGMRAARPGPQIPRGSHPREDQRWGALQHTGPLTAAWWPFFHTRTDEGTAELHLCRRAAPPGSK